MATADIEDTSFGLPKVRKDGFGRGYLIVRIEKQPQPGMRRGQDGSRPLW